MVACKKSGLLKTHQTLPFISRIGPVVTSLVKGISILRPLKPRYIFIRDVEQALNQLKTYATNPELSVMKLPMLLALTTT